MAKRVKPAATKNPKEVVVTDQIYKNIVGPDLIRHFPRRTAVIEVIKDPESEPIIIIQSSNAETASVLSICGNPALQNLNISLALSSEKKPRNISPQTAQIAAFQELFLKE